ncbi:MAG TPA: ABC transporter substrate-binding protein, partial [Acidimicrobiia bacterium]|nr:ABC transporter substrate-binding protein [Acidimicrobiia bacterium]
SDLTGPFSPLVGAIVTGQEVYWEEVNANGGINGLQVVLEIRDTGYVVDNHVQMYDELKDKVVAFGHSTGSPHTVAINPQLQEDGILAIPLTWYSGWSDPAINSNLLPHGAPYCIEAQNVIGWAVEQNPDLSTLAIVSLPGDYGQDSAAGAKIAAEALGLEIVYDGEATVVPTDEAGLAAAADAIVSANPDMVWITTTPTMFGAIFGQALAKGYQGLWSGAAPTYNPAFVAPDSPIKDVVAATTFWGSYYETWSGTSPGTQEAKALLLERRPDITPFDFYFEGMIEAKIMHEALLKAYENGDLTQAGVLAAAKSLEEVDFNGLAPNETYVGDANSTVQRVMNIIKPDPEGLAAGTSGGTVIVEANYTSANAAAYEFTGACYVLGGG